MSELGLAKKHTVKLREGSGVLINGETDEYSYVLTAKHVVMGCGTDEEPNCVDCSACTKKDTCTEPICNDLSIVRLNENKLLATEMYLSNQWDALILKVPFQSDLSLTGSFENIEPNATITILGYPENERENTSELVSQIRNFKCNHHDETIEIKRIILRNNSYASQAAIAGFSGGGLFYLDTEANTVTVVGVETRMDNDEAEHGHICGVMLSAHTDIIEENQLAELKPLHLSNFKQLSGGMFPRSYYQHIFDFKHAEFEPLLNWIKAHCNHNLDNLSFTPLQILSDFKKYLSVNDRNPIELEDKACWEKFLELLTLVSIVNDKGFGELEPAALFEEFKIVYIRSNKPWEEHFSEVLTVDTSSLTKNGKILLFFNDVKGENAVIPKKTVDSCVANISGARTDPGAIDAAETIRKEGHTLIHWASLHDEKIFSQPEELKDLTGSEPGLVKVRELYRQYLEFQEGLNV
ncbi:MAG: ABC-three component system protein [Pontiella sp.]